jgi:hypothetical protein
MGYFKQRLELNGQGVGDRELKRALRPYSSRLPWYWLTRTWRSRALNYVYLRETSVTSEGLEDLSDLRHVKWLDLHGCKHIDAVSLLKIGAHRELEILNLEYTGVQDDWLPCLKGLYGLGWLSLLGTRVTRQGVQELRNSLSRPHIIYNNGMDEGTSD